MVNILLIKNHTALLAQVLSLIIIIMSYQRLPLHKVFNTIEREILLKLFVFLIICFYLLAFSYFSFDYFNITEYILYFALLLLLPAIGLLHTIKSIYFFTNKVPMQLHDVKNVLLGLHISAKGASDINSIKDELSKALEIIGIDDINIETIDGDTYFNSILSFINMKKKRSTKEIIFSNNIQYYESNAKIPLATILYMLGVLLDNAIDSGTKKVIFIKVHVSERYIEVTVSNEYTKKSTDDFENMFQERYTTKQENKTHGYGLPNLSRVVRSFGGEIQLEYSYNKEQEKNYLTFTIAIKN
jgi:sensor histidine kinase regulating citrate/malate metabolism